MTATLPVLVPGRSESINVPCELPDSFLFMAYLPSRGLRKFAVWLRSTDVREAEIKDVAAVWRPDEVEDLDEDEQRRADEAAGDVLDALLASLAIRTVTREAAYEHSTLATIALAHEAECKAWEALRLAHVAVNGRTTFYEARPAFERHGNGWVSKAANLLEAYVTRCLDEARTAQRIKAEKQEAEWTPPPKHHEDVNPPEWAEP